MGIIIYPYEIKTKVRTMNGNLDKLNLSIVSQKMRLKSATSSTAKALLMGQAWDTVMNYVDSVQLPLLETYSLWIREQKAANNKFGTEAGILPRVSELNEDQLNNQLRYWERRLDREYDREHPRSSVIRRCKGMIRDIRSKLLSMERFVHATEGIYDGAAQVLAILQTAQNQLNGVTYDQTEQKIHFDEISNDWLLELNSAAARSYLLTNGVTETEIKNLDDMGFAPEDVRAVYQEMKTAEDRSAITSLMKGEYRTAIQTDAKKISPAVAAFIEQYTLELRKKPAEEYLQRIGINKETISELESLGIAPEVMKEIQIALGEAAVNRNALKEALHPDSWEGIDATERKAMLAVTIAALENEDFEWMLSECAYSKLPDEAVAGLSAQERFTGSTYLKGAATPLDSYQALHGGAGIPSYQGTASNYYGYSRLEAVCDYYKDYIGGLSQQGALKEATEQKLFQRAAVMTGFYGVTESVVLHTPTVESQWVKLDEKSDKLTLQMTVKGENRKTSFTVSEFVEGNNVDVELDRAVKVTLDSFRYKAKDAATDIAKEAISTIAGEKIPSPVAGVGSGINTLIEMGERSRQNKVIINNQKVLNAGNLGQALHMSAIYVQYEGNEVEFAYTDIDTDRIQQDLDGMKNTFNQDKESFYSELPKECTVKDILNWLKEYDDSPDNLDDFLDVSNRYYSALGKEK